MMSSAINDFKSKLNGLLTSLHTLSNSEQEVAVSLLSSTLSAELNSLAPFEAKTQASSHLLFTNIDSYNRNCKDFKRDLSDSSVVPPVCSSIEETESSSCPTARLTFGSKLPKKRGSGESLKTETYFSSGLSESSTKNDLQHHRFEPNKFGTVLLSQPQEIFSRSQTCTSSSETCLSLKEIKTQSQEKRPLFEKIFHASQSGANCKHLQLSVLKSSEVPSESVRVITREDSKTLSPRLKVVKPQAVSLKPEGHMSSKVSLSPGEGSRASAKSFQSESKTVPTEPTRITFSNEENSQEELADNEAHQQTSVSFSQGLCARAETVHAHVQASSLPQQTKYTSDEIMQAQQQTTISLQCHESVHSMVYQISSSNDVSYRSWGKIQTQAHGVQPEANISQIQGSVPQAQECFAPSEAGVPQVTDGSVIKVNCCDDAGLVNNVDNDSIMVVSSSSPSYENAGSGQKNLVVAEDSNRTDDIDSSIQPSPLALDKYSMARDLREATETLEKSFSSLKEQQQWHLQQQTLVFTDSLCDHFGPSDEVVCRRSFQGNHDNDVLDHLAPSYSQRATQLLDHSLRVLGFNQTTRECGLDVLVASHFDLPSDFSEVLDYSIQGKSEKLVEEEMPTDLSVDHEFDLKSVSSGSRNIEVTNSLYRTPEAKESLDEVSEPTDLSLSNMYKDKCVLADNHAFGAACSNSSSWCHRKKLECDLATKESLLDESVQYTVAHNVIQQDQSPVGDNALDHLPSRTESTHRKCIKRKNMQLECDEKDISISSSELLNFGVQDVVYDLSLPPNVSGSEKTLLCDASYAPVLSPSPKTNPDQNIKKTEILSFGDFSINLDTIIPDDAKNFSISGSSVDNVLHCETAQPKTRSSSQSSALGTSLVASTTESTGATLIVGDDSSECREDEHCNTSKKSLSSACKEENSLLDIECSNVYINKTSENLLLACQKSRASKGKGKKIIKGKTIAKSKNLRKSKRKASTVPKAKIEDDHHDLENRKPGEHKTCETKLQAKQPYMCEICNVEFVHKVTYVRHMRGHSSNKCSLCPSSFSSYKALRHHSLVSHNTSIRAKAYDCQLCWRSFTKRVHLHAHTAKQHAAQGMLVCEKCGTALPSTSAMQQHLREHSTSELPCSLCSASFSRRQTLLNHLKGHERNACRECGAACSSSRQLIAHCRLAHPLLAPKSPLADDLHHEEGDSNNSGSSDTFLDHESPGNDSINARVRFVSSGFPKLSPTRSLVLQREKRAPKTEQKALASKDKCKNGLPSGASKTCQVESGPGCASRSLCGHTSPPSAPTHQNTFDELENYSDENILESCKTTAVRHGDGQAFAGSTPSSKVSSVRRKFRAPSHVFGRIHACPHCPRQFGRPSLLKEHITAHSGESAFRCEQCNKSFATRSGHRKHLTSALHVSSRPRVDLSSLELNHQNLGVSDNISLNPRSESKNSINLKSEVLHSQADNSNRSCSSDVGKDIVKEASSNDGFILQDAEVTGARDPKRVREGLGTCGIDAPGVGVPSENTRITNRDNCSDAVFTQASDPVVVDRADKNDPSLVAPAESVGSAAGLALVENVAYVPSAVCESSNTHVSTLQLVTDGELQTLAFGGNSSAMRRGAASLYQTVAGKKPNFACNLCDYVTNSKFCIKRHIDTHFNRRRFVCEACGKAFLSLLNLQDHHAFVHSTEKRFTCSLCSHSFKTRSSLVRHLQKHSTEKPYQCHCGNKYKRLSYLKRHKLSVHNEVSKVRNLIKVSALIHLSSPDSKNRPYDELEKCQNSDLEEQSEVFSPRKNIDDGDKKFSSKVASNVNLLSTTAGGTPEILDLTQSNIAMRKNCVNNHIDENCIVSLKISESLNPLPLATDPSKNVVILFNNLPYVNMSRPSQSDSNFSVTKSEVSSCEVTPAISHMIPGTTEDFVASTSLSSGPADLVAAASCTNSRTLNTRAAEESPCVIVDASELSLFNCRGAGGASRPATAVSESILNS